ncbi:MAG: dTDP-4-dehydrorhamnose reductase [Sphingomicrobium sp.]|jgi:dTDP-4-dehydrorhamnose reductase
MRVVVTGRSGQVVCALIELCSPEHEIIALGRPRLDLTAPQEAIIATLRGADPQIIISAAAYTQVDKAESEPELAFAVNESGARAVATAARELNVPLIHLSTDYVFDGKKAEPYVEDDQTNPQTVYGASKLAGERAVLAEHVDAAVLRTAWIYSPFGTNFAKTMLRLAQQREQISVVADQHGNPTSALDIAEALIKIASNLLVNDDENLRGIFHMTGSDEATWAELAEGIFSASSQCGGPSATVISIPTAQYPTPAKRPPNSRLNSTRLEQIHNVRLPNWRNSVQPVVSRLVNEGGVY